MVNQGIVDAGFIAISERKHAIATIHYHGVVLADKRLAHIWLNSISTAQNTQLAWQ